MQDAYPSQAEGGLADMISSELKKALKIWDQKRWEKIPRGMGGNINIRRAKAPKREEVSWNPKPQVLLEKQIKVPRDPRPAKVKGPDLPGLSRGQRHRNGMTPEQREAHLARRRAEYRAKAGPPKQRPKMDMDKRRESVKRACRAFRARKKALKYGAQQNQTIVAS
jgi:hypothetical protein